MIKLTIKIILFFVISNLLAYLIISTSLSKVLIGKEVYEAISLSKKKTKLDKVLLGDSVARQLYNHDNYVGDYYLLTTTGSISLVGQYILFKNIIDRNTNVKEVVLISVPSSLSIDLDNRFIDNYFIKPFCTLDNSKYFSATVYDKLSEHKYYSALWIPMFKIIGSFPGIDHSGRPQNKNFWYLSDVSIEYLIKMKNEANSRKIKLKILPAPISNIYIKNMDYIKKQIKDNNLESIFSDYFDNIVYLDDYKFIDHLHFKKLSGTDLIQYRNMTIHQVRHIKK